MPITNPLSLTDDEVYAVSAYVLFVNGIVGEDAVMNAQTLPQVKMPQPRRIRERLAAAGAN